MQNYDFSNACFMRQEKCDMMNSFNNYQPNEGFDFRQVTDCNCFSDGKNFQVFTKLTLFERGDNFTGIHISYSVRHDALQEDESVTFQ